MTIDERLDRLTERHEALAQSTGVLVATVHEMAETQAATNRNFQARFDAFLKVVLRHEERLDKLKGH